MKCKVSSPVLSCSNPILAVMVDQEGKHCITAISRGLPLRVGDINEGVALHEKDLCRLQFWPNFRKDTPKLDQDDCAVIIGRVRVGNQHTFAVSKDFQRIPKNSKDFQRPSKNCKESENRPECATAFCADGCG